MKPEIKFAADAVEFVTPERCHISEVANDPDDAAASIARARVEPGVTTAWHSLSGIAERYIIISGEGRVELQGVEATQVSAGDVVRIPAGIAQRITNTGECDLIFYCVCTPRFRLAGYKSLDKRVMS